MNRIILLLGLIFLLPAAGFSQFEKAKDSVVQLIGVIMTADSLDGISNASVIIKGTNRGTITNNDGVFSIAVLKGDIIEITHVSYKPVTIVIPADLKGTQHSVVQLLVQDNTYLPATIIRPRPTKEQFARDFVNTKVNDEDLENLRKNYSASVRRVLLRTTPGDGKEASNLELNKAFQKARYQGQLPPMQIFNPAAWVDFINAWKRGDFKNKKN